MPAGLEIINDFGSILIDSVNPCLIHVATYTQANVVFGGGSGSIDITDCTPETMLAYQGTSNTTNQWVQVFSPTHKRFHFVGLSPGFNYKFYRFEKVRNLGSTVGLVLRNGQGEVTFDALQKPARVISALNSPGSFTYAAGSYAIVFSQTQTLTTYSMYDPEDGGGLILDSQTVQSRGSLSGNVVAYNPSQVINTNTQRVPNGTPVPPASGGGSGLAIVLDVTGY